METLEEYRKEYERLLEEFNNTYGILKEVKGMLDSYDKVVSAYESSDEDTQYALRSLMDSMNVELISSSSVETLRYVLKEKLDGLYSLQSDIVNIAYEFDTLSDEFGIWSDFALEVYDKIQLLSMKLKK